MWNDNISITNDSLVKYIIIQFTAIIRNIIGNKYFRHERFFSEMLCRAQDGSSLHFLAQR